MDIILIHGGAEDSTHHITIRGNGDGVRLIIIRGMDIHTMRHTIAIHIDQTIDPTISRHINRRADLRETL